MSNLSPKSARALTREASRKRRESQRERRRTLLDLVVAGYAYEQIADQFEVSVGTIRREIDRALAARPIDSTPPRYVALQVARLQKAMLVVDLALDGGDLRAIPALATLLGEFDRYHGLAALIRARTPPARALHETAPKALESLDQPTK